MRLRRPHSLSDGRFGGFCGMGGLWRERPLQGLQCSVDQFQCVALVACRGHSAVDV